MTAARAAVPDAAEWPHAVQADLPRGPAFQPCPCADTAAALFDRLRLRFPGLALQRLQNGRVVEMVRAPTEQQKADLDLLLTGSSIMLGGRRIDPATVFIRPPVDPAPG